METPSSARRVTRSQTLAGQNSANSNNIPVSRKTEDSEKGLSKSRQRNAKQQQQDRSALIDITNDSPIVGLAMGSSETPASAIGRQRNSRVKSTPGSGEALLRGQVKTLLQKVEEEAELSKLSLENRPIIHLQGFVNSPMILAPTPANTPQVPNVYGDASIIRNGLDSATASPFVEDLVKISEVGIFDGKNEQNLESQKSLGISRSLLLDFSEKSDLSDSSECSSVLTYQGVIAGESECKEKSSTDVDDDASVWSIQVNASTHDEDEEEVEDASYEDDYDNEDEEEFDDDDGGLLVDELCEGISKMSVKEKTMAKFTGKHTKFMYNSDDEIVEEEEEESASPSMLCLKGWPTPKGKHLRFAMVEEADN